MKMNKIEIEGNDNQKTFWHIRKFFGLAVLMAYIADCGHNGEN